MTLLSEGSALIPSDTSEQIQTGTTDQYGQYRFTVKTRGTYMVEARSKDRERLLGNGQCNVTIGVNQSLHLGNGPHGTGDPNSCDPNNPSGGGPYGPGGNNEPDNQGGNH